MAPGSVNFPLKIISPEFHAAYGYICCQHKHIYNKLFPSLVFTILFCRKKSVFMCWRKEICILKNTLCVNNTSSYSLFTSKRRISWEIVKKLNIEWKIIVIFWAVKSCFNEKCLSAFWLIISFHIFFRQRIEKLKINFRKFTHLWERENVRCNGQRRKKKADSTWLEFQWNQFEYCNKKRANCNCFVCDYL